MSSAFPTANRFSPRSRGAAAVWLVLCGLGGGMAGCSRSAAVLAPSEVVTDDHRADEAKLARHFPGAKLREIPLPVDAASLRRLSERSGLKFSGAEREWEAFEATRNGKRIGLAMLCHADLAQGVEIHLGFSVDPKLKVQQAVGMERTNAGFQGFVRQFNGKTAQSPFQVGRDLKAVADYPPQFSRVLADTVHRGLVFLEAASHAQGAASS